ncbi:hypothetical protein WN943_018196 [Citrus x changshan-huyou]
MASTWLQIAFFYSFLYIIAVDASGKKPNISTFGADQFDDFDPDEENIKASFFSRQMFSSFVGALCATLNLVYIQENMRSGLGYVIPIVGYLNRKLQLPADNPFELNKLLRCKITLNVGNAMSITL